MYEKWSICSLENASFVEYFQKLDILEMSRGSFVEGRVHRIQFELFWNSSSRQVFTIYDTES